MRKPLNEDFYKGESKDSAEDYLDFSSVFSALIQADRGSFFEWAPSTFNIPFNTNVLVKSSRLSKLRMEFQEQVLSQILFMKANGFKGAYGDWKDKNFS